MSKKEWEKLYRQGWRVRRGAYIGTCDDRADGWYAYDPATRISDRRGPGWATRRAAIEEIVRRVAAREER